MNIRSMIYSQLGLTHLVHHTSKLSREDRKYLESPVKDSTTRSLLIAKSAIDFLTSNSDGDEVKSKMFRQVAHCVRLCSQFMVVNIDPRLLDIKQPANSNYCLHDLVQSDGVQNQVSLMMEKNSTVSKHTERVAMMMIWMVMNTKRNTQKITS